MAFSMQMVIVPASVYENNATAPFLLLSLTLFVEILI